MDSGLRSLLAGLCLVAAGGVSLVQAQNSPQNAGPIVLPPATSSPITLPNNAAAPEAAPTNAEAGQVERPAARKPETVAPEKPQLPAGPPPPARSPTAILRVLDKVTAETMRFEAPVGRRVRYKSLIFTVKTCETRGQSDPLPRPSAYVVILSQPQAPPGQPAPPAREIYRGWMFADSPSLHPFEHPVYDAWLEACTQATP